MTKHRSSDKACERGHSRLPEDQGDEAVREKGGSRRTLFVATVLVAIVGFNRGVSQMTVWLPLD